MRLISTKIIFCALHRAEAWRDCHFCITIPAHLKEGKNGEDGIETISEAIVSLKVCSAADGSCPDQRPLGQIPNVPCFYTSAKV